MIENKSPWVLGLGSVVAIAIGAAIKRSTRLPRYDAHVRGWEDRFNPAERPQHDAHVRAPAPQYDAHVRAMESRPQHDAHVRTMRGLPQYDAHVNARLSRSPRYWVVGGGSGRPTVLRTDSLEEAAEALRKEQKSGFRGWDSGILDGELKGDGEYVWVKPDGTPGW